METLSAILYNASAFIIILTVIVFIHEFGHYFVAKVSGVKIEQFSIGFGKELFGFYDKSGTRWKFCLLPLGGYVKMFGDIDPASAPDSEKIKGFTEEEKKVAFHTKSLPIKSAIVAAGPMANFVLAIVIMTFFFSMNGKPTTIAEISAISEGSAAEKAGLQSGDLITKIDNNNIETFTDLQRVIAINTGTPIEIVYERDGQKQKTTATPLIVEKEDVFGNIIKAPLLGVSSTEVSYKKLSVISAMGASVTETYSIAASTLKAIGQMITGERSPKEISGPLGIAKYSGQSAEKGMNTVLWFIVVLSINLGLVNLFPIPLLDGGHLLYYAVEAVQGKPLADRVQQIGFKIGIALVGTLFIFALINDIQKLN
jgi:regulator of sigma E protease